MAQSILHTPDKEMDLARRSCQLYFKLITPSEYLTYFQSNDSPWDWNRFFELILLHKLDAFIFFAFRQINMAKRRPKVMDRLLKIRKNKSQHKLNLFGEHSRVLKAFDDAGIDVVSYKGNTFAAQYYPNQRLRDSVDIDLAIHEKDILASTQLMKSMGYVLHKDQAADEQNILESRSYLIDFSWVKYNDAGRIIYNTEVHWQPSHSVLWVPLRFEDIMHCTADVDVFNQSITTFDRLLQVIIVITHHGLVDGWGKMRHLVDLAHILRKLGQEDMHKLLPMLQQYKIYRCFLIGHELLVSIFGFTPFDNIPRYRSNMIPKMAKAILANELVGKWSDQRIKLYYYLRMRDGWRDRLISLAKFGSFYWREKRRSTQ